MHLVTRELTDCPDLLRLHRAYPDRYPAFLTSAAHGSTQGQHDVLFCCPQGYLALDARQRLGGLRSADDEPADFLKALDTWWREERVPAGPPDLPFTGGWFIYLGYEMAAQVEPSLTLPMPATAPVALAVRIPVALVRNCATGAVCLVAETAFEHLVDEVLADFAELPPSASAALPEVELREEPAEQYLTAVERAKRYIVDGDVFQANLSRQWRGELPDDVDDATLFSRLSAANPGPFAGLLHWRDWSVISSSPERLLRLRGGVAETRPIAGTRPRAAGRPQDEALKAALIANPKERAEHIMLIDLERNDLGRICQPGTIDVDQVMTIESYAHVHHIVSNVRGTLRQDVTPGDAIRAVFPGGTITGCPKVRCMEIIAELEGRPRSAYTGSFGYLNRDGSMDLNILIRTLERSGRELTIGAGAGIVADSEAAAELAECRAKALGLLRALES
ncbi:MAG: aminodeoxychorismate synthase component I [Pseudomonadota bacterium]